MDTRKLVALTTNSLAQAVGAGSDQPEGATQPAGAPTGRGTLAGAGRVAWGACWALLGPGWRSAIVSASRNRVSRQTDVLGYVTKLPAQTSEAARPTPRVLAKDVEATVESAVTWLYIASVKLMSRRLAAA